MLRAGRRRSAKRDGDEPINRGDYVGVRIALGRALPERSPPVSRERPQSAGAPETTGQSPGGFDAPTTLEPSTGKLRFRVDGNEAVALDKFEADDRRVPQRSNALRVEIAPIPRELLDIAANFVQIERVNGVGRGDVKRFLRIAYR